MIEINYLIKNLTKNHKFFFKFIYGFGVIFGYLLKLMIEINYLIKNLTKNHKFFFKFIYGFGHFIQYRWNKNKLIDRFDMKMNDVEIYIFLFGSFSFCWSTTPFDRTNSRFIRASTHLRWLKISYRPFKLASNLSIIAHFLVKWGDFSRN